MKVVLQLDKSSESITYESAVAVYQKGDMLCISYWRETNYLKMVDKYPINHVFRVVQEYTNSPSGRQAC